MNWLETPETERPALETRQRTPGKIEARCPACGAWRPGFTIAPLSPTEAALRGVTWACDGDRTLWARL